MKYCILVPTYNNERTLEKVLNGVLGISKNVIVVNDGSTDGTSEILKRFTDKVTLINYNENQGKGNALQLGFHKAFDMGLDYAITIDSDGQHYPEDIALLLEQIEQNPGNLVMGSRNMEQASVPGKSSFGNKFSSFWFWVETGISLTDTQTGFRAYPLASIQGLKFYTKRFEFEIEIIVRLAWKNVKISEANIKVEYSEDRVSHFRPFQDFSRVGMVHTVAVTLGLLFFLPRLLIWNFSIQKIWDKIKIEFSKDVKHPVKLASAVGLGLFFGILPIWGFQMMAGFAVASWFKLNRALVLLISNISIPPMIPLIVYGSFKTGALFVENPVYLVTLSEVDAQTIYLQVRQYVIGSSILAIGLAMIGFIITWVTITLSNLFKKQVSY